MTSTKPPSKLIPLEDATAGMVLAQNLTGSHNEMLLPAGTVLTSAMITSLSRHQVEEITIELEAEIDVNQSANDALKLQKKIARLDQLFALTETQPLNLQLKTYVLNFLSAEQP